MTNFTIKVWYRATDEGEEPQTHTGLDAFNAYRGADAFLRDLLRLEGQGVRRLTIEVEGEAPSLDPELQSELVPDGTYGGARGPYV